MLRGSLIHVPQPMPNERNTILYKDDLISEVFAWISVALAGIVVLLGVGALTVAVASRKK